MKPDRDSKTLLQTKSAALNKTQLAELLSGLLTAGMFLIFVVIVFSNQAWWLPGLIVITLVFILPAILLILAVYRHVFRQSRSGFYAMFLLAGYLSFVQLAPFLTGGGDAKRSPYLAAAGVILTLLTFTFGIINSAKSDK